MRSRVTRDGTKLIVSTTDGYLMVVHDLDLNRLTRDLFGFNPGRHHLLRHGTETAKPSEDLFLELFTARRNRVEIIDDFPMDDEPNMVPSLEVCNHSCTWVVESYRSRSLDFLAWKVIEFEEPVIDIRHIANN